MPDPILQIQQRLAAKGKTVTEERIKEKLSDPSFRKAQFATYGKEMGYKTLGDFESALAPSIPSLSFPAPGVTPVAPKEDIPSPVGPSRFAKGAYEFNKYTTSKKSKDGQPEFSPEDQGVADVSLTDAALQKSVSERPPVLYDEPAPEVAQTVRNFNMEIRDLEKYQQGLKAQQETNGRTDMQEMVQVQKDIASLIDQRTRYMAENKEKLPIEMLTPREYLDRVPDIHGIKQVKEEFQNADDIEAVQRGDSPKVSMSQKEYRQAFKADPEIHRFNAETTANSIYLQEIGRATNLTMTTLESKYGEKLFPLLRKANEEPDKLTDKELFVLTELDKDPLFARWQDQVGSAQKWQDRTAAIIERYPNVRKLKAEGLQDMRAIDAAMANYPTMGAVSDFTKRFARGVVLNTSKIVTSSKFTEYEALTKSKMGIPEDGPLWATSSKFSKPFRTKVADFTSPDGKKLEALYSDDGQFAGVYSKTTGLKVSNEDPGLFDPKLKMRTNWSSGAAMATEVTGDLAVTILLTRGMGGLASLASVKNAAALTRWVGLPVASQIQFQNRWIQQGLQEGMTFDQASNYSMGVSALIAMVQPLYGFEAGIAEKFSEGMWKGITARSVQRALTNPATFWKKAGQVLMDITGESAEEVFENGLERYVGNRIANDMYGSHLKTGYKDWKEFKEDVYETAFVTAMATGPMSVVTNVFDNSTNQSLLRNYFLAAAQDIEKYKETINELRRAGKLDNTKDYYEAELEGIANKHREVFESDAYTDEMKKDLIMHEMQGIQLLNKAAIHKDPNSPQAKAIMEQYDQNQEAIAKLLKDKKSPAENPSQITPNVQLQEDSQADQQEPDAVTETTAATEQPQQSAVERAVQAVRDKVAGKQTTAGNTSVDKAAEQGNTSIDTKPPTDGKEEVQAQGQEVATEKTFTVPTSNESAGATVEVDQETYDKWKKVDDEEKKWADQIRRSKNKSAEQKNKELKANAMSYAAEKRKVLGTLTEKEKSKAVKLQSGDQVTVGDQTWVIDNPSAYGKVRIKNTETGEVQTVGRDHVVPQTVLANKKEAIQPRSKPQPAQPAGQVTQTTGQATEYTGDKTKVEGKNLNPFNRRAHNAAAFLSALGFPIKIVVHSTEESFFQATGTNRSSGVYQDGVIHLNEQASLDKNELSTRSIHESWHPILMHIKAADKNLYNQISKFMYKEARKNPTLAKILNEFTQRYHNANAVALSKGEDAPFSKDDIEEEAMTEFLTQVADNPNMLTMNGKQSLAKSVLSTFRRYSRFFIGTDNRAVADMSEDDLVEIIQAAAAAFSGDLTKAAQVKEKLITRAKFEDFDSTPESVLGLRDWAFIPTTNDLTKVFGKENVKKVDGGYIVINTPIQEVMNKGGLMGVDNIITPDGIVNPASGTLVPISDRVVVNQETTLPSFGTGKNKISVIPVTGARFRRKGKNSLLSGAEENANQEDFDIEKAFAKSIIAGKAKLEDHEFFSDYVDITDKEKGLIHGNNVLYVGSGPVPFTPILLSRKGFNVTGLDISEEANVLGEQVAKLAGSPIKTITEDGTVNNYSGYDTVIIALEAGPPPEIKKAIIDQVSRTADLGTSVVIRSANQENREGGFVNSSGLIPAGMVEYGRVDIFGGLSSSIGVKVESRPVTSQTKNSLLPAQHNPLGMVNQNLLAQSQLHPDRSPLFAELTADGNDFLFYHYSKATRKFIDPAFAGTGMTPTAEQRDFGLGGNISMWYTRQEVAEQGVGSVQHIIRIPMDQVYDFETDAMGFKEEARARYEANNPGLAFNVNAQLAWITKVAADNGFPITVARWGTGGMARAHSGHALQPNYVSNKETGERNPSFTSNKELGWAQIVPATKAQQLNQLYEAISDFYGKLYNIRKMMYYKFDSQYASFKSQEEITQAINDSDLPAQYKELYNQLQAGEDIKGKAVFLGPGHNVEFSAKQATLADFFPENTQKGALYKDNWSIITAGNPQMQPLSEEENKQRNDQLEQRLKEQGFQYVRVNEKYGNPEQSFIVTGITPDQALSLGREFDQESVITRYGMVYQDGTMNPAEGTATLHDSRPDDNYTEYGSGFFTLNYDWSKRIPLNQKHSLIPEGTFWENTSLITHASTLASSKKFGRGRDFGIELQDRFAKEYLPKLKKIYGKDFDPQKLNDPRVMDYLSKAFAEEMKIAIKGFPDAIGWYDHKVKAAMAAISLLHPEIKEQRSHEIAMKMAIAITSNGNKVEQNFFEAERQYAAFKSTGKFDAEKSVGSQSDAIKKSLWMINSLLEVGHTMEDLHEFMTTKYAAGDLFFRDKDGKKVKIASDELAKEIVYGAIVLRPKIGNGFYMNLNGAYDQLTIDRWFMKTWGRLTGKTVNTDKSILAKAKARIANAQKSLTAEDKKILRKNFPEVLQGTSMEKAAAVFKANLKSSNRDIFGTSKTLNEYRIAANDYTKKEEGSILRPQNGEQRKWIREVFQAAIDQLAKEGITITNADGQAAIWYPEKALYDATGADMSFEEAADEQSEDLPDYEQAAIKLAEANGISRERIDDVIGRSLEQGSEGDGIRPVRDDHTAEERIQGTKTAVEAAAKARRERNKKKNSLLPPSGTDSTTKAQLFGMYGENGQEFRIDVPTDFNAIGVDDGAVLNVGDNVQFPSLLEAFPFLANSSITVELNPFNDVGSEITSINSDPNAFSMQATVTGATQFDINKGIVEVLRDAAREVVGYNQQRMSLIPDYTRHLRESKDDIFSLLSGESQSEKEKFVDVMAKDFGVSPMEIMAGLANVGIVWDYKGRKLNKTVFRALPIGISAVTESFYITSDSTTLGQDMADYAESVIGWGSPDAFDVLMEEVSEYDRNAETRHVAAHLLLGMVAAYSNIGDEEHAIKTMTEAKRLSSSSGQVLEAMRSIHRKNPLPSMASAMMDTFFMRNQRSGIDETEVNSTVADIRSTTRHTPEEVETATMTAEAVRQSRNVPENTTLFNQVISQVRGIFSTILGKQSLLSEITAGNGVEAMSNILVKMVDRGVTAAQAVYYGLRALDKVNKEYEAAHGTPIFANNQEILDFFSDVLKKQAAGTNISTAAYLILRSPYTVNMTQLQGILDYSVTPEVILKQLVSYVYSSNNVGGKHLSEVIMSSPFFASYTLDDAVAIEKAVAEEMKKKYGERVKNDISNLVKNLVDKRFFGEERIEFRSNIRTSVEKIVDAYYYGLLFDDTLKAMVAAMYLGDAGAVEAVNRIIELAKARAKTTSTLVHRQIDKEASFIAFKTNPSFIARSAVNFFSLLINGLLGGMTTLVAATLMSLFVTLPKIAARSTIGFFRGILDTVFRGKEYISPFAFLQDHLKTKQFNPITLFENAFTSLLRGDSKGDHKQTFFGDDAIHTMGGMRPQSDVDRALTNGILDAFKAWSKANSFKTIGQAAIQSMTTLITMPLRVTTFLKTYEQSVASLTVPYLAYTEAISRGRERGLSGQALLEYARKKAGYGNINFAHSEAARKMRELATKPEFQHMFRKDVGGAITMKNGLPVPTLRYKDLYSSLVEDEMMLQADNDFTTIGEFLYKDMQMMGQPEGWVAVAALEMMGKTKPDILSNHDNKWKLVGSILTSMLGYSLFPFARMIAQTMSVTYQYSVLGGIITATKHATGNRDVYVGESTGRTIPKPFIGKLSGDKITKRMKSNMELYEQYLLIAGHMVAVFAGAFMMMFDWDDDDNLVLREDRPFDVTFRLTGSNSGNKMKVPDQKTLSFKWKDKQGQWQEWWSYKYAMVSIPYLAVIGAIRDYIMFSKEDKADLNDVAMTALLAPVLALTEQTFAMTINTITQAAYEMTYESQKKDAGDEMVTGVQEIMKTALVDVGAKSLRTVLSGGNFARDVYADFTKASDPEGGYTSSKANSFSEELEIALFKDSPIFEKLILGERNKVYDSFGNLIPREYKYKELQELTAQALIGPIPVPLLNTPFALSPFAGNIDFTPKDDAYLAQPEIKLISKFPRVSAPSKYKVPAKMTTSDGRPIILSEDTKSKMQIQVGHIMRDYIRNNYDALDKNFSEKELTEALGMIFQDAVGVMKYRTKIKDDQGNEIGLLATGGVRYDILPWNVYLSKIRGKAIKTEFDNSRTLKEMGVEEEK